MEPENIVAAVTDPSRDKFSLLEEVLANSKFFETLEEAWAKSGKPKNEFIVAVKPNLSMALRRNDVGVYTDPFLVIHLLRLLLKRGFANLRVVESQNLYGNWFTNRGVVQVAARCGYFPETDPEALAGKSRHAIRVRGGGVDAEVPLIDMTLEPSVFADAPDGERIEVGKAWAEADFRISFPKFKTHFYSTYTLAIKNVYGCLPRQDKVRHYHCKKRVGSWTARAIRLFPVHFSVVDGYTGADGVVGVKMKAICRKPYTMIAGRDIMAVDHAGATLMRVKPEKSSMYRELSALQAPAPYRLLGRPKPARPWFNVPYLFVFFTVLIEANAWLMDYAGSLATGGFDACFRHKSVEAFWWKKLLYWLTLPVNIFLDLGFLRLRFREWLFFRKLKKLAALAPILTGSELLMECLARMSPQDVRGLMGILNRHSMTPPFFSGHYFFLNGFEKTLPAKLSIANLAVYDMLLYLSRHEVTAETLIAELAALLSAQPDIFGKNDSCGACYY
ncbi:MAG: DUF362 domain-containing protein [Thermodesulfobacteriota bacterium]